MANTQKSAVILVQEAEDKVWMTTVSATSGSEWSLKQEGFRIGASVILRGLPITAHHPGQPLGTIPAEILGGTVKAKRTTRGFRTAHCVMKKVTNSGLKQLLRET